MNIKWTACELGLLVLASVTVYGQVITTVAGNGTRGFCGDGGLATSACLNDPGGMDVDAAGNLYIADIHNMRVRKVTPAGTITTVAGNGIGDFTGDVGQATSLSLWFPIDVAVDTNGNLYIADLANHRIRKVDPKGLMTTVAGGGPCCGLRDGGPASRANLDDPMAVAVDSVGNFYIADYGHVRIRRVGTNGRIDTIAGTGGQGFTGDGGQATAATLSFPTEVAVDTAGNVYFATSTRILKVTPSGTIITVAGGGSQTEDGIPATSAQLEVRGLVVDRHRNLYFVDLVSRIRVRKVNADGIITTVVDGLSGGRLAMDTIGNLYISQSLTNRVLKVAF